MKYILSQKYDLYFRVIGFFVISQRRHVDGETLSFYCTR